MPGKVLVVDGNNLIARYEHVYNNVLNPDGIPVGGLFGLVQGMRKFLAEHNDHTAAVVVVDRGVPAWRMEVCPEYKQQRADERKTPEDERTFQNYRTQVKHARSVIRHLGVGFARAKGWEGDDVIAGLVEHRFADRECTIYSSDRDFIELGSARVRVYNPLDHVWLPANPWYLLERCMDPKASDNLDGVPGVGPAGASAVVQLWQYHMQSTRPPEQHFARANRPAMEDFLKWCGYVAPYGVTQAQLKAMPDRAAAKKLRADLAEMSPDERKAAQVAAKVLPYAQKVRDNYQVTCLRSIAKRVHADTRLDVEPADRSAFKDMMRAYAIKPVLEDFSAVWPVFERLDCQSLVPAGAACG